jgi:hypothetical protein
MSRPSLPSAMTRPMPQPQTRPGMSSPRPGLGTMRPGGVGGTGGMTRPAPQPGAGISSLNRPGGSLGGGAASRPGGGFATRPTPSLRPGQPGLGGAGGGNGGPPRPGLGNRPTTLPGQVGGGATTLPGAVNRPSLGATTKPFPQPGVGGNGPGGNRPGAGTNRPVTLPGQVGGERPGIGGNRPGIGGDRPGIGGNRPVTLPGQVGGDRPGSGGNRPGVGGDRPGIGGNRPGQGDRPGIGGNRPGVGNGIGNNVGNGIGNGIGNGSGNNIGNSISGGNSFNNINVNGGGWGYPGGGWNHGGWGYGGYGGWGGGYGGYVNPHYGGWYSGCWNGNWGGGYGGGWWAPFALGAATWGLASSIGGWGLGYGALGYGTGAYVNPYYASMPATVVASAPYDYGQPIVVNNYITSDDDRTNGVDSQGGAGGTTTGAGGAAAPVNDAANKAVDDALASFKAGDYTAALAGFDRAVKLSPKDSVLHELRALALFALGRYPEAAATLNAVLVSAPGMDWTTVSNVYGSVDTYTAHLRKLEDYCRTNPDSAAGHFVLAYHYLVGGHADTAVDALKVVVAKQPGDMVAKRLLEAISPPQVPQAEATPAADDGAAAPAAPETDLVGTWKASSGNDSVLLTITEDSKFTWKATPAGRPAVELSGTVETARDALVLESEKAGPMVGKVRSQGPDAFEFSLAGAPKEAKPLVFQRQK